MLIVLGSGLTLGLVASHGCAYRELDLTHANASYHLMAVDSQSAYSDNLGAVRLDVCEVS